MNHQNPPNTDTLAELKEEFETTRELIDALPVAVRSEQCPRIRRLETMLHALERDIEEASTSSGASPETVESLCAEVSLRLSNLHHEIEILSMGAPSTLTSALDASVRAANQIGGKIREITARVPLLPR